MPPQITNGGDRTSSVRDLWTLVRAYFAENGRARVVMVGLALLAAIDLVILFAVPLVTEDMVNALVSAGSRTFWDRLMVLTGLVVLKAPIAFLVNASVMQIDESVALLVRKRAMEGVLGGTLERMESHTVGDLASRLVNDIGAVKSVVTSMLLQPAVDVVSLIALVIILFRLNGALALLLCLSVPGSLLLRAGTQEAIRARAQQVRESLGGLSHRITAWLSSSVDLKTNRLEQPAVQSVDASGQAYRRFAVRSGRFGAGVSAVNAAIVGIPTLVVFGYGGQLVLTGSLSVGALVAFFAYVGYFTAPIQRLMTFWVTGIPAIAPSARRVLSLWQSADGAPSPARAENAATAVTVEQFDYVRSGRAARADWRLSVDRLELGCGDVVVFCGPNGSGKTTLLRSLAGAYRAAAHTLRAGRTVYVSEHPPIFPGSLIQNVTMFTEDVDWHRVGVIAGEIGLSEIVAQFPSGWDTFMDPAAVGRLSAGQTKRLALARAMYSQREIWLLDEPFDSLDDAHSRLFSAAIARARSTHIIVIATHDNLKWLPPDSRICQFESDVSGGGFVVREIEHPGATLRAV